MDTPTSRENSPHYAWGAVCDGWRLLDSGDLTVIEESVPPGAAERRHFHRFARQFFYVLEGEATLEIEGREHRVTKHQGIEVAPGQHHQFLNRSTTDVTFLVISSPATKGDRHEDSP